MQDVLEIDETTSAAESATESSWTMYIPPASATEPCMPAAQGPAAVNIIRAREEARYLGAMGDDQD